MTLDFPAATRLARQLGELPELLAYAHLALLPGAGRRGARVSGATRTAPLPCSVDVLSLLGPAAGPRGAVVDPHGDQTGPTPIIGTLSSWVRLHEEEGPFADCADYTAGGMLDYLRARNVLAWAVLQPWADEYAAEIDDTHRALQPYVLLRARRRLLQVPCPRCQLLTLVVEDGRDAECENPGCGVILRPAEIDDRIERYLLEINAAA
jgi:hypothetical protein